METNTAKIKATIGSFTVPVYSRLPTDDGRGYKSVKIGTRTGMVEVLMDVSKLEYLAKKAVSAKSGMTTLHGGAIVVSVVKGTLAEKREASDV